MGSALLLGVASRVVGSAGLLAPALLVVIHKRKTEIAKARLGGPKRESHRCP